MADVFVADVIGPVLVGVALAVFGLFLAYAVRDPLQRRRQGRQELQASVCELLRRLDMADLNEEHAADLGRLSERRRRGGALWGNRESGRQLEKAEAEAELLKSSIKELDYFALRAHGSSREGLRNFSKTLVRFAGSWDQVATRGARYETSSRIGLATRSATQVAQQEQASKMARAELDDARKHCADEGAELGSEMQKLKERWCRD